MPVTFAPMAVGDVVRLSATGPRVEVVSPSDLRMSVPAPDGYIDLWLAEAGVWTVDGTEITAVAAAPADPPTPQLAPIAEARLIGSDSRSRLQAGDAFVVRQTYRDPDTLAYVDPGAVRFRIWKPGWASATDLPHERKSAGVYDAHGTVWEGGTHYVEAEAAGGWRAVTRVELSVDGPLMPPS